MREFAATPPATARVVLPVCLSATMVRGINMALTEAEKLAHRSGILISSPFCRVLWIRLTAAVFRPEKDISKGLPESFGCGMG